MSTALNPTAYFTATYFPMGTAPPHLARTASQDAMYRDIVSLLHQRGIFAENAADFAFAWRIGVREEAHLVAIRDDEGRQIFDPKGPKLFGLPIMWVGGGGIDLDVQLKYRPTVAIHADRIADAARELRAAFPGPRLAELLAALTATEG